MFVMIKNNVERIVNNEADKARLLAQGFRILPTEEKKEKDIDKMNIAELKILAEKKGFKDFEKMKKEELINTLKELDVNDGKNN